MKTQNINKLLNLGLGVVFVAGMAACTSNGTETASEVETMESTTNMGGVDAATDATTNATAMDTWDNDRFGTTFESNNMYSTWDANADDMLDENEFNAAFYSTWDSNRDNMLDENEWNTGTADFGISGQNWADWDTNSDNNLSSDEFRTGFSRSNYWRDWDSDRDGMINQREYSTGIFNTWDTNRDGSLDNNEYSTRYNRYYGGGR